MALTVKLDDQANAALELYLGWARAQASGSGEKPPRINKEDVVSEAVRTFVGARLPAGMLKHVMKEDSK